MPAFILLAIIVVVVLLVAKAIHDGQRANKPESATAPDPRVLRPPRRPARPPRRPARSVASSPPVDERALAAHVRKLQEAIGEGLVTTDEAVASICRSTDNALSEEAARELLRRQGAA